MADFQVPEGGCYIDLRRMVRASMAEKGLPVHVAHEEKLYQQLRSRMLAEGRERVYVERARLPAVPANTVPLPALGHPTRTHRLLNTSTPDKVFDDPSGHMVH